MPRNSCRAFAERGRGKLFTASTFDANGTAPSLAERHPQEFPKAKWRDHCRLLDVLRLYRNLVVNQPELVGNFKQNQQSQRITRPESLSPSSMPATPQWAESISLALLTAWTCWHVIPYEKPLGSTEPRGDTANVYPPCS
ncbi:hypothetical protein SKAU_G00250670 [Synaphobranchus kaupii]|uniref:Uncharacterized protein n=1 Tax=Synaphobranchus kaupii TaxID=118154 RepID=A0A9Q1F364_SYNKA|nr:hypothetical protein SKAU_G00250670 [Synaphobranchus kaupii]